MSYNKEKKKARQLFLLSTSKYIESSLIFLIDVVDSFHEYLTRSISFYEHFAIEFFPNR